MTEQLIIQPVFICIEQICYYRYLERGNSISTTKNIRRSQGLLQIADNLKQFYEQKTIKELDNYVKDYLASLCENAIHLAILSDIGINEIFQEDKEAFGINQIWGISRKVVEKKYLSVK